MHNRINIDIARAALARAAWAGGKVPNYGEGAVIDLLANIRHHCEAADLDFERCNRVAAAYFTDEHLAAS